jgi:hypothetical protein
MTRWLDEKRVRPNPIQIIELSPTKLNPNNKWMVEWHTTLKGHYFSGTELLKNRKQVSKFVNRIKRKEIKPDDVGTMGQHDLLVKLMRGK